jgi:hypothetical protein
MLVGWPSFPAAEEDAAAIKATIEGWARAWENNVNSLAAYRSYYHPDFYSNYKARSGMNYRQWMADKEAKAKKASCISVTVSDLKVQVMESSATARFMQRYASNTYCDQGEKTLFLLKQDGAWKIVGEEQPAVTKCPDRCGAGGENKFLGTWFWEGAGGGEMTIKSDGTYTTTTYDEYSRVIDRSSGTYKIDGNILLIYWSGGSDGFQYGVEDGQAVLYQDGEIAYYKK